MKRKTRQRVRVGGWLASLLAALVSTAACMPEGVPAALAFPLVLAAISAGWHPWLRDEGGVPVIAYHSVSPRGGWLPGSRENCVSPDTFERHLRAIRDAGYSVVTVAEIAEARREGRALPRRCAAIDFDDGYLDNWVAAFPILKRFGYRASLYVCTDFVEQGEHPRPTLDDVEAGRNPVTDLRWEGYLNWAELRRVVAEGSVDVQSHGTDHLRVETGPRVVDTLRPENWKRLAWVQWRAMPGPKADWFRHAGPPVRAYGTPVRENASALVAAAWEAAGSESSEACDARVLGVLERSRSILEKELGKSVRIFCWPFNESRPRARELARQAGYEATTGGRGENRPDECAHEISRIHLNDRGLGWRRPVAEGFVLHANLRLFSGSYYWYPVVAAMNLSRKLLLPLWARLEPERP